MKVVITETDGRPIGDIITPLSFTLTQEKLVAEVHPYVRPIFDETVGEGIAYPASPTVFERLTKRLSTCVLEMGYEKEPFATSWGYHLTLQDATEIPLKIDFSSPITEEMVDNYQNLLICDLKGKILSGCPVVAVVKDAQILSAATTHFSLSQSKGGVAEIMVETAPAARGCGYAASCVASLARELLARGFSVLYRSRAQNAASLAVAKKSGFRQVAQFYQFVGRRDLYGL